MSNSPIKLNIPRQNLHKFGLFELNAEAARIWAEGLPITNTRSVVLQLRHALSDLNHLSIGPELRYEIMEALLPKLDVALGNLSKKYLNQPLVMPEEPRQMAEVADSLCNMARTGYTIVAIHTIQQRDSIRETNPARLACESIQRALLFSGRKILQAYQLYNPIEQRDWQTLHQLIALAEEQGLDQLPVTEPLGGGKTVTATYLQALLLGCGKPNQMRQQDLAAFYRGLKDWSDSVSLEEPASGQGLFLVDFDSDQPPLYAWLYNEKPGNRCRLIDTQALTERLEQLKAGVGKEGVIFDKDSTMPVNILEHLIASLSSMSLRNFNRTSANSTLLVCFGLSSSHYHIAGERTFEQLIFGDDYIAPAGSRAQSNPFMKPPSTADQWQKANPEHDFDRRQELHTSEGEERIAHEIEVDEETLAELLYEEDVAVPPKERYPVYKVPLADASPGGYCLEWLDNLPGDIKTGDIVSLKEGVDKEWMLAVIRWVSHSEDNKTFIGLELLSPRAMPYGARIQRKTGGSTAPMRVLLLPEIKLVGQPHTLITPRAGFRERQKVTLVNRGEEFFIQLLRQTSATGSFAQFDFRYIKQLGEMLGNDNNQPLEAAYDSLWNQI